MANGLTTPITGQKILMWAIGVAVSITTIVVIVYFAGLAWKASQKPKMTTV